jgi:hypothetical protein
MMRSLSGERAQLSGSAHAKSDVRDWPANRSFNRNGLELSAAQVRRSYDISAVFSKRNQLWRRYGGRRQIWCARSNSNASVLMVVLQRRRSAHHHRAWPASPADSTPQCDIRRDRYTGAADCRTDFADGSRRPSDGNWPLKIGVASPFIMTAQLGQAGSTRALYCGCRCSAMKSTNALSFGVICRLAGQRTLN